MSHGIIGAVVNSDDEAVDVLPMTPVTISSVVASASADVERSSVGGDGPESGAGRQDSAGRKSQQPSRQVAGWLFRRRWPIATTVMMLGMGITYLLCFGSVVHHRPVWTTGGDLWGITQAAQAVARGRFGGVYDSGTFVLSVPGMELLLAPIAKVVAWAHLTANVGPYRFDHPSAALVLVPVEMLVASTTVFAGDALAERWGVGTGRRAGLCLVVGAAAWPVAAVWGHAEDCLSVAIAMYALMAMLDDRWVRAGWLLGCAIAVQPLVGLLVPLVVGAAPSGRRVGLVLRSAALSVALVALALVDDPAATFHAVLQQPTPIELNHGTPWAALSPVVAHTSIVVDGVRRHLTIVAGGPARMIYVALAVLVGVVVWRRPQAPVRLVWLGALVLAGRCFFEPVMTPYYLAPPLILCLVLAARHSTRRFTAAVVLALAVTVFTYFHLEPWVWWLPVVASMTSLVMLGYPTADVPTTDQREVAPCEARSTVP
jgi:hypothetical protein